jgi:uncharacterized protein YggL (DUF469 family)
MVCMLRVRTRTLPRLRDSRRRFGFQVQFWYDPTLSVSEVERLNEAWFHCVLESKGLAFVGRGPGVLEWDGFVTRRDGGSAEEGMRVSLERWFAQTAGVAEYRIGPLEAVDTSWIFDHGS